MFDGERGKMARGTDFCGPAVVVARASPRNKLQVLAEDRLVGETGVW